eukprot:GHVN01009047.1.p1 GENE.GHVN01009047.1~~GHVN01009047.1.p1  ORF type:complete len:132 (-),score=5.99 GHVN01009047.1:1128-1523(-)
MSNSVSQHVLICSSCNQKRFSGSSFQYICGGCSSLLCRECAGYDLSWLFSNQSAQGQLVPEPSVPSTSLAEKSDIHLVLGAIQNVNAKIDPLQHELNTLKVELNTLKVELNSRLCFLENQQEAASSRGQQN